MVSLLARVHNAGSFKSGGSTTVSTGQTTGDSGRSLPVRSYLGSAGESARALAAREDTVALAEAGHESK